MVATESSGLWGQASPVAPPVGSRYQLQDSLRSVACPAVGRCVAVGSYEEGASSHERPMFVSETATGWNLAAKLTLPAGASSGAQGTLASVACPAVTQCVAAGGFLDRAATPEQPILASGPLASLGRALVASTRSLARSRRISTSEPDPLHAVSCSSKHACVAVGREIAVASTK